ncbi:MAG: hypothetical protein HDQ87_06440 [Clostridia bacterium]|nr:hypothetical protein [Clostridia bacterium]
MRKRKAALAALLLAGCFQLSGCGGIISGEDSLRPQEWIDGTQDRTQIARSVGAAGVSISREAASAAKDVIAALFEGAGIDSIADFMPTAEELAGFIPEAGAAAEDNSQGETT